MTYKIVGNITARISNMNMAGLRKSKAGSGAVDPLDKLRNAGAQTTRRRSQESSSDTLGD